MKVRELIEILQGLDQDALVVSSKDAEGNGFSPTAREYSTGGYQADSSWSGDFFDDARVVGEDDEGHDYIDDSDHQRCVVLWPVN